MRKIILILLVIVSMIMTGCSSEPTIKNLNRVGLLFEGTIDDQGWNSKGYQGLLKIQSQLKVDVFYKEGINQLSKAKEAIEEYEKNDVNLIFGHGRIFADFFQELKEDYPDIHFVSFNGDVEGEGITSLHFESHAMGFFGGMVAAKMSESNKIGVIAAYSWQPEVNGFIEGAKFQNENVDIKVEFVNEWDNVEKALELFRSMENEGVDVFYPAGDGYHIAVVDEVKKAGLYAIGFISDQIDLGESTILTSTVQHVDELYYVAASKFSRGELESGNQYYDFKDGVISMGTFSSTIPGPFRSELESVIEAYKETGILPNN